MMVCELCIEETFNCFFKRALEVVGTSISNSRAYRSREAATSNSSSILWSALALEYHSSKVLNQFRAKNEDPTFFSRIMTCRLYGHYLASNIKLAFSSSMLPGDEETALLASITRCRIRASLVDRYPPNPFCKLSAA